MADRKITVWVSPALAAFMRNEYACWDSDVVLRQRIEEHVLYRMLGALIDGSESVTLELPAHGDERCDENAADTEFDDDIPF